MVTLKHKLFMILPALLTVGLLLTINPKVAYAETLICPDGREFEVASEVAVANSTDLCDKAQGITVDCQSGLKGECGILDKIVDFTNVLAGLVGIVIVIMITIGGIQYSTARDNPQAVEAARKKIYNAVAALILFIFGMALLNWLVPGGVF